MSRNKEVHFNFKHDLKGNEGLKLITKSNNFEDDNDHPIIVTVRFDHGTFSWTIPYETNYEIERVFCLLKELEKVEITIVISTFNENDINFKVKMQEMSDYYTNVNQKKSTGRVTVGSSIFHYVDLSSITGYLQISVKSKDEVCSMISIHSLECPISQTDINSLIPTSDHWQTMLRVGSFTINADEYDKGMFIKFTVLESGSTCGLQDSKNSSPKLFTYEIINHRTATDIFIEITVTVLIISMISFICIIISCITFRRQFRKITDVDEGVDTTDNNASDLARAEAPSAPKYKKHLVQLNQNEENFNKLQKMCQNGEFQHFSTLSKTMYQQSELYIWLVILMSICYGIPAIQLVFKYQTVLQSTGNNDLCYYNFLCSFPSYKIQDFNHIISNLGYMIFGLAFLIIIWYKQYIYRKRMKEVQRGTIEPSGIPLHFGIFYSLGIALIVEGILSACYHVCPTNENFQFDTTFMYVIAILLIVKVYQFRHPDVSSNAYKIFFGISLVIFLEVIGIFNGNNAFWIVLALIQITVLGALTSILYQSSKWKRPWQVVSFKLYKYS